MKHVLFALFPRQSNAQAALQDLALAGVPPEKCNLIVHRDALDLQQLPRLSETDSRHGVGLGLLMGAVMGGVAGWLAAGPLHLLSVAPGALAFFCALAGAVLGALGGMLEGAALPDRRLRRLARSLGQGRTLITAEVEGLTVEEQVETIFRRHGAVETPKAAV